MVREITQELSTEYEISKVLRQYPKDTVLIKNPKGYDMSIISGVCNTREKIAQSINCEVSQITDRIIEAMENPVKVDKFTDLSEYDTSDADLSKLPILTHYKLLLELFLPVTLKVVFKMHLFIV